MTGLLQKNVKPSKRGAVPYGRNRLVGTFSRLPEEDFSKTSQLIQPIFQQMGFAPLLLIRPVGTDEHFRHISINHAGSYAALAFARVLYIPGERRGLSEPEIDSFITLCARVAETLDNQLRPRGGWFGRKRESSVTLAQPVMPIFDKTREQAMNLSWRYSAFLNNLPNYQRSVEVHVDDLDVNQDELDDFLEFVGFPKDPIQEGVWYDPETDATLRLLPGKAVFEIASVPRTPEAETVFANIRESAKRMAGEFGARMTDNEAVSRQVILGWKNILAQIGFQTGDEEVREFFPHAPGDPLRP